MMKTWSILCGWFLLWMFGSTPAFANQEAVVTVPVATVHKQAAGGSETVTQVPMGDRVVVLKTTGTWVSVRVTDQYRLADGYPGWMLRSQLVMPATPGSAPVTVIIPKLAVRSAGRPDAPVINHAYLGTGLVPTGKISGGWLQVTLPDRQTGWVMQTQVTADPIPAAGEDVVRMAEAFSGTPYVWGGISVDGIDCSGLTFIVYRVHGIVLARDADQQFEMGEPIKKDQLQPGDLVFYGKAADHITHVGIYKGKGLMVEASSDGNAVRVSTVDHRTDYQGARRMIGVDLSMPPPSP